MKSESGYRISLLNAAALLQITLEELFTLGYNLVLFEDLQNGNMNFDDGEEIPCDIALLEASDDVAVKALVSCIYKVDKALDSLKNINLISEEELEEYLYSEEEDPSDSPRPRYSYWLEKTADFLDLQVFFLLKYCYCMAYDVPEVPDKIDPLITYPDENVLLMLKVGDHNVDLLSELSGFLSETAVVINEYESKIAEREDR